MSSNYYDFLIMFGGLAVGFVLTLVTTLILCRYAERLGLIDKPDHRKIHSKPIPRIGGLGLFAGLMGSLLYFSLVRQIWPQELGGLQMPNIYFLTGGVVIAVTGLVDDFKGISFRQKLVAQCLIAVYLILAGYRLQLNFGILDGYANMASIPVTFLWLIGVINAVNLIDGMDGLAGGIFLISLLALTICYTLLGGAIDLIFLFSITGTVLGFLVLNTHPAKVFMGDTGSLFLGYVIACYSLNVSTLGHNHFMYMVPIIAVGLPVFDTLLSMTRRFLKGRPVFYPDKDHMHHRVRKVFGGGQRAAVMRLYYINLVLGALAILLSLAGDWMAILIMLVTVCFAIAVIWRLKYLKPKELLKRRKQPRHRGLLSTGGAFPYRF
ncbi:MraY family glycosyltransferase [Ruficoccus sp. ZRK36]|uniref:MraY family glycosyltransferase n=1 Tax=Ruficoccus sp. ZRK36 TaxID=2866311 RepID=UPI001C732A27|nr:MraY family glycosyltransferase [Ruficoccus sp. ZRK36]QYY36552.1 undecaprenyl/decaprenyl-phosphate alpha-N-acetylglucosaminyl 1-phosphate transferase [Ruficoccus sp. ZRK36]